MSMRISFLLLMLLMAACAQVPPPAAPAQLVITRVPALSAVAACPVVDEQVRHLVELNLSEDGRGATYFHRDLTTGEWMENFSVPLRSALRFAPSERVRTGVILRAEGNQLTVRWRSRPGTDTVTFPSPEALGRLLGRVVGPRGDLKRELSATVVVAYEQRCDEPGAGSLLW
jgi:hypothetical protein